MILVANKQFCRYKVGTLVFRKEEISSRCDFDAILPILALKIYNFLFFYYIYCICNKKVLK